MRAAGALLAAALAVGGCVGGPSGGPVTPEVLAARLPTEIAGFQRGATLPLPPDEGGREAGGQEVAYATRGRLAAGATVELYRVDGGLVPDGADSPAVSAAFDALLADALRPVRHRRQQERLRLSLPEGVPGAMRCAETIGRYGREGVRGLLCAGGIGGGVVRLRVTMPDREPLPADPQAFASGVFAALRGG